MGNIFDNYKFVKCPNSPGQQAIHYLTGIEIENPKVIGLAVSVGLGLLAFNGAGAIVFLGIPLALTEFLGGSRDFTILRKIRADNLALAGHDPELLEPSEEPGTWIEEEYDSATGQWVRVKPSSTPQTNQPVSTPQALSYDPETRTHQRGDTQLFTTMSVAATPAPEAAGGVEIDYSAKLQAVLANPTAMPIRDRAELLLDAFKADGCDIRQFITAQMFVACGGERSGKSTLLMLISILDAALNGKKLRYITVDDDIYPIAFYEAGIENREKDFVDYYKMIKHLSSLKKHSASDEAWIVDEITRALKVMHEDASKQFWGVMTTGFKKTGGTARLILHGTTARRMGLPDGDSEYVKENAVFIKGIPTTNSKGQTCPSGQYVQLEADGHKMLETDKVFKIPDWLIIDKNEEGFPCYVHSLLRFFPELDTRVGAELPKGIFERNEGRKNHIQLSLLSNSPTQKIGLHGESEKQEVTLDDPTVDEGIFHNEESFPLADEMLSSLNSIETPIMDKLAAALAPKPDKQAQCLGGLIEFLRDYAKANSRDNPILIKRGDISRGSWSAKWRRDGALFEKTTDPVYQMMVNAMVNYKFLSIKDENTYEVIVR